MAAFGSAIWQWHGWPPLTTFVGVAMLIITRLLRSRGVPGTAAYPRVKYPPVLRVLPELAVGLVVAGLVFFFTSSLRIQWVVFWIVLGSSLFVFVVRLPLPGVAIRFCGYALLALFGLSAGHGLRSWYFWAVIGVIILYAVLYWGFKRTLTGRRYWFLLLALLSLGLGHVASVNHAFSLVVDGEKIPDPLLLGMLNTGLIVASVMIFLAAACSRVFHRGGSAQILWPLCLLLPSIILHMLAIIFPSPAEVSTGNVDGQSYGLLCISLAFFATGVTWFVVELSWIIHDETLRSSIWEPIDYQAKSKPKDRDRGAVLESSLDRAEGKQHKEHKKSNDKPEATDEAVRGETVDIGEDLLRGLVHIQPGDTILAVCDPIDAGRPLARRLIETGDYGTYISVDRPWTAVERIFVHSLGCNKHVFCIDCCTGFYGLGEFSRARNCSEVRNFHPYTPEPITVRNLHNCLREVRKRTIWSLMPEAQGRDYRDLDYVFDYWNRHKLYDELNRRERELGANMRIVYDSVSALASIVGIEDLLRFLIHDTNHDKLIGRNTLLLVQDGELEEGVVKRIEAFCDISLDVRLESKGNWVGPGISFTIRKSVKTRVLEPRGAMRLALPLFPSRHLAGRLGPTNGTLFPWTLDY